jgi:hypothetical protein
MTNTSNLYRKARSLVAKTVTAGCTPHEHVAATNLAVGIIMKRGLDVGRGADGAHRDEAHQHPPVRRYRQSTYNSHRKAY